ncbi:hypothetical protein CENSYa_0763 [Cenarchaeum symbiosum A]|uniref:Uncharacterized protein n=1 Tax=Cenarchaeum symbiosum (strain A) TaxID=414004 RepID=A0RVM9_CENSY|nr:hypothetical protein CENSYa_0763 [Cenarchaeum symbiosum A]
MAAVSLFYFQRIGGLIALCAPHHGRRTCQFSHAHAAFVNRAMFFGRLTSRIVPRVCLTVPAEHASATSQALARLNRYTGQTLLQFLRYEKTYLHPLRVLSGRAQASVRHKPILPENAVNVNPGTGASASAQNARDQLGSTSAPVMTLEPQLSAIKVTKFTDVLRTQD